MCNITKEALCLLMGVAIGIIVGYQNEEEIEELARSTKRAKRRMMKKMYDVKDHFDM